VRAITVPDRDDMHLLGMRLASLLLPGDLVILSGGLGAGKTTLTQGIGRGMRVRGEVTSPTFVIARVHPATQVGPPLVHVDAYRLGSLVEVDDLDLDTSLEDSVTVVEWGEGRVEGLSENRLEVQIDRAIGASSSGDQDSRTVSLNGVGPRWADVDLDDLDLDLGLDGVVDTDTLGRR